MVTEYQLRRAYKSSLLLLLVVLLATPFVSPTTHNADYQAARSHYQQSLDTHSLRVSSSIATVYDDKLGIRSDTHGGMSCDTLCAVVTRKNEQEGTGYTLSLPVGFTGVNATTKLPTFGSITRLIYWNPVTHRVDTIENDSGAPLQLPDVLKPRTIDMLTPGQTAYTAGAFVRPTTDGELLVLKNIPVLWEPVGKQYRMIATVRVTKLTSGVLICIPADQYPASTIADKDEGYLVVKRLNSC